MNMYLEQSFKKSYKCFGIHVNKWLNQPQSIAVATAATGIQGTEGKILNATLKFCLIYVIVLGMITYFGAALFTL